MKKFGLLTTLLISGLLLTGCNETVENSEIINEEITSPVIMTVTESWFNNIDCGSFNWETQKFTECYNVTWYLYTFTRPDIKLRITTDKYSWPWFLEKTDEPFIELTWNEIVWIKWRVESWSSDNIRIYRKDPNKPLKEILEEKHVNSWCKLRDATKFYLEDGRLFSGIKTVYQVWPENGAISSDNWCYTDDIDPNEKRYRTYVEWSDPSFYYKIVPCECWPLGKFIWKVEIL